MVSVLRYKRYKRRVGVASEVQSIIINVTLLLFISRFVLLVKFITHNMLMILLSIYFPNSNISITFYH